MTERAVIYTRVSSTSQAGEDRTSLKVQLRDCRALAKENGYEVIAELKDVAPGTSRKRDGYRQVCQMVATAEIDVVVAWREDRLYRGFAVVLLKDALDTNPSATVHLVRETFDRTKMSLMAGIAEHEIETTRQRMESGWRERLRRGKLGPGEVLYGYQRAEDGTAEVNGVEAGVIRRIFRLYLGGRSWIEVRGILAAEGHTNRKGGRWHTAHLKRIVNHETYFSGKRTYTRRATFKPENFEITYPPIIDEATWFAAQTKRVANRERYRGHATKAPALLRGLITCAPHNATLAVRRRRMAYLCQHTNRRPEDAHPGCAGYLRIQRVDKIVWRMVVGAISEGGRLEVEVLGQLTELSERATDVRTGLAQAQRRSGTVESERQQIIRLARQGIITDDDLTLQLDELSVERLHLERVIADAGGRLAMVLDPGDAQAEIGRRVQDLRYQLEVGAPLAKTLSKARFEEPEDEATWVGQVLAQYDPGGSILEKFGGDQGSAAEFAVVEWQRSILDQVVDRVLVTKQDNGEREMDVRFSTKLALRFPTNLGTPSWERVTSLVICWRQILVDLY